MSAFSDYPTLKATLAGWVHRADVNTIATGAGVNNATAAWITLFEAWASRKLREWNMEKVATQPVATEYVDAPADMLELKDLVLTDGFVRWRLEPASQFVIDRAMAVPSFSGRPEYYAFVGGKLRFFPTPDKSYSAVLTYYAGLAVLSDLNPTNWLLALAPDAYLYGALINAAPYLKDMASISVWKTMRDEAMDSIRDAQRQPSARLRNEFVARPGLSAWNIYSDT